MLLILRVEGLKKAITIIDIDKVRMHTEGEYSGELTGNIPLFITIPRSQFGDLVADINDTQKELEQNNGS